MQIGHCAYRLARGFQLCDALKLGEEELVWVLWLFLCQLRAKEVEQLEHILLIHIGDCLLAWIDYSRHLSFFLDD